MCGLFFSPALEIAPCISSISAIPGGHAGMTALRSFFFVIALSYSVTLANDSRDGGGRATQDAKAEAGVQVIRISKCEYKVILKH